MVKKATALPKPPARDIEGLILPHSVQVERSTLGAALIQSSAADYIADHLTPADYFRRAHRVIFEAMVELRRAGAEVDLLTLQTALKKRKKLDDIGGPVYLTGLTDGVPRSSNVAHYAGILKDLSAKRALIGYANQTLDLVAAGEHGSERLIADADRRLIERPRRRYTTTSSGESSIAGN